MTRARRFTSLELTARFDRSYRRLPALLQRQCDKALAQLLTQPVATGLHLKPIRPSNHYWEARVDRGHRLILLPAGEVGYIIGVVVHDDIARWSAPR